MISPRDPHVPRMLRYIDRPLALLLVFDIVVVVAYVYFEQRWLALPNLPLSIGGGALGVLLGFRNHVSYARWWEARTLWGRIVNYSRCVGRQAIAYISVGDQPQDRRMIRDIQRRIVYHQIAYVMNPTPEGGGLYLYEGGFDCSTFPFPTPRALMTGACAWDLRPGLSLRRLATCLHAGRFPGRTLLWAPPETTRDGKEPGVP
jgi:hypothetical protein